MKEYLLLCIAEEAAEIIHCCTKAIRFGTNDANPYDLSKGTNGEELVKELNDLLALAELLAETNSMDMSKYDDWASKLAKKERFYQYREYHLERMG